MQTIPELIPELLEFPPVKLVLVGLGLFLVVMSAPYAYRHLDVVRQLPGTTVTGAGEVDSPGLVAATGRVTDAETVESKNDVAEDGVVSAWRVEELQNSRRGGSWVTTEAGVDSGRFALESDGGSVTVDPPSVSGDTETAEQSIPFYSGDGVYVDDCRVVLETFEQQFEVEGDSGLLPLFGKDYGTRRIFEGTITPDEDVYVLGHADIADDETQRLGASDVVVGPDPDGDDPFVISNLEPGRLVERVRRRFVLATGLTVIGLVLVYQFFSVRLIFVLLELLL